MFLRIAYEGPKNLITTVKLSPPFRLNRARPIGHRLTICLHLRGEKNREMFVTPLWWQSVTRWPCYMMGVCENKMTLFGDRTNQSRNNVRTGVHKTNSHSHEFNNKKATIQIPLSELGFCFENKIPPQILCDRVFATCFL